jgi:peptide/nickel transport system permease protein
VLKLPIRAPGVAMLVARRLGFGIVTLLVVSIAIFVATQALGDPARAILGHSATPAGVADLRKQLHLDRPLVSQYLDWLDRLLHGKLGNSIAADEPVTTLIGDRIVNSAFLMLISALVSIPIALVIGIYAGLRRDRRFDTISGIGLLVLIAVPEFIMGVVLIVVFATNTVHWLPAVSILSPGASPWRHARELVLPTATLVLAVVPYVARMMRASMVEVLESDYVEMARLKGLPDRWVVWRHALPNALPATFQVIAINLAYLAGGIVVVEYVFNYPGIGSALRDAVANRDLPVLQAVTILIATFYVVVNLLGDLATIMVTPRLRTRLR